MSNNNSSEELKRDLERLGAREYEIVALTMDPIRGSAALAYAISKGAEHPVSYAIKMFDTADWQPSGETRRRATNVSVDVRCDTCGGDRFVVHRTRQPVASAWMASRGITPSDEPIEEMKPCPSCNADLDAGFWRADGTRFKQAQ